MAVQDGYGKVSGSESLVFAYDLKDTLNSYRGEPTTNLATGLGLYDLGAGLTYIGIEDGWKKYSMGGTWNGGGYPYCMALEPVTFNGGSVYTTKATIKTNVEYKFNYFGVSGINYVNEPMNNGGVGTATINSDGSRTVSRYNFAYTNTTNQLGYLNTNPINGTTFNPSSDFVWLKEYQSEQKSHPTPFINGTRSTTQGLLDLTGNNTINLSNVSFDSNAKMVFDGTNDYIGFGDVSGNIGGKSQATMELILKIDALKSNDLQEVFGFRNNSNFDFYMIILPSENSGLTEFRVRNSSGTYYDLNPNINSYIGNYIHIIFSVGPGGRKVYFNGSLVDSSPTWTGSFGATSPFSVGNYLVGMIWSVLGEIPVAKLYDRELSSTEITNNYLKYKRQYGLT